MRSSEEHCSQKVLSLEWKKEMSAGCPLRLLVTGNLKQTESNFGIVYRFTLDSGSSDVNTRSKSVDRRQ